MTDNADLVSSLERLRDLTEQKLDCLNKMLRLYCIAGLLDVHPGAINGSVRTHVQYGYNARKPWASASFVIRTGGSITIVPMVDVPHPLWPKDMLEAYKRAG
jgi:hypothetical protein